MDWWISREHARAPGFAAQLWDPLVGLLPFIRPPKAAQARAA